MKKLLLQSAIVALVSTSVAGSVVANITAKGHAILTFQAGSLQPVSAVAASSLNLSFPVKAGLTPATFKLANKEGAKLNALYELSSANKTQGCIQFSHIDNTIMGGGLIDIDKEHKITFNTEALQWNTLDGSNILFLTENGKCGTPPSTGQFTTLSDALIAAKIGPDFSYNRSASDDQKPTSIDGEIALYYRIPESSLLTLRLNDPATVSNEFDFNKATNLNGQLRLAVTTTR